jgi:hypothetical protein
MTPSVSPDQREAIKLYLALMEEVKVRVSVVNETYHNQFGYPAQMVREICYLQFRFLCEMVALGCLIIHGDIKRPKSLSKIYQPGKILTSLERLHNSFYPQRIEVIRDEATKTIQYRARADLPQLSKRELARLWTRSGELLHRGSFNSLREAEEIVQSLKPIDSTPEKFPDIFEWSEKIVGLLNCHWITLTENKTGLVVSLLAEGGRAKASILNFDGAEAATVVVEQFRFSSV